MDRVTQQNASLVEESAAAAAALEEQASRLTRAVAVFRIQQEQMKAREFASAKSVATPVMSRKAATADAGITGKRSDRACCAGWRLRLTRPTVQGFVGPVSAAPPGDIKAADA